MIHFVFGNNVIIGTYTPQTGIVIANPTNDLAEVMNTEIEVQATQSDLAIIGWYAAAERVLRQFGATVDTSGVPALDKNLAY